MKIVDFIYRYPIFKLSCVLKIGHRDSSPVNDRQGDMPYTYIYPVTCPWQVSIGPACPRLMHWAWGHVAGGPPPASVGSQPRPIFDSASPATGTCHLINVHGGWHIKYRTDSKFVPSQWKTSSPSNAVSHWLGANLESVLRYFWHLIAAPAWVTAARGMDYYYN